MRITAATLHRYDLKLTEPYTIAYETIAGATNFALRLETDRGVTGWGCAAPDAVITGERADDVERAFHGVLEPLLRGADPHYYPALLDELKRQGAKASVRTMADAALYDLVSRAAGVPLYKYLGAYRGSVPTSVTVGILPVEETLLRVRRWTEAGFSILKIKGGLDWQEDVARLRRVRDRFPGLTLRFDGNQGYDADQAVAFATAVEPLDVEIFEQPLSVQEEETYAAVRRQVPQPVMADESLKTLADAFRLAKGGLVNMINIKLMKVGGLQEGMHINSVARSAGYEVMVGCLDECALGIAAGLHFALSRPNVAYADLDSFLDFAEDPFEGLFHLREGVLYPTERPGLGWEG